MKSKLLRKLAKSQKYLILAEIKRSQGLSVSQLCERINLSYMGVKQHCVALEKDGYLDTWRRPKGMADPRKPYRLTLMAQEFFPRKHTNFTSEILKSLEQVYGPAAPEKILYQIYQNSPCACSRRSPGHTLEERARSFAALRDQGRLLSEYYFNPDIQRHQIIEYNSPIFDRGGPVQDFDPAREQPARKYSRRARGARGRTGPPVFISASSRCSIEASPPRDGRPFLLSPLHGICAARSRVERDAPNPGQPSPLFSTPHRSVLPAAMSRSFVFRGEDRYRLAGGSGRHLRHRSPHRQPRASCLDHRLGIADGMQSQLWAAMTRRFGSMTLIRSPGSHLA